MGAGGGFREQPLKTLLYVLLAALIVIWMAAALRHAAVRSRTLPPGIARLAAGALLAACVVGGGSRGADAGDQRTTRIPFPRPDPQGPGGFGLTSTNGLQIHQFGWDAMFKYRGFSASGEYVLRLVDPRGERPLAPWTQLTGQRDTTAQHGAYVQCGYMLPIPGLERKLEVVGRIGGMSALADGREATWEYAGGVNCYFRGDDVKLPADVTKVSEVPIPSSPHSLANVNDDALIFRVQVQLAF